MEYSARAEKNVIATVIFILYFNSGNVIGLFKIFRFSFFKGQGIPQQNKN